MNRLLQELRRPPRAVVDAALASLVVRIDGETAIVSRGQGTPLFGGDRAAHIVRIEPEVYAHTPTTGARTELLSAAAAIAPRVEVHVPLSTDGTWRGRLVFDLPRRAARALGLPAPEPGDRHTRELAHAFFDDELLIEEAERAGLVFIARRGSWIAFERSAVPMTEEAAPFATELARVLRTVREAERQRHRDSPERAVATMRERGRGSRTRGPVGRARLRRAIGWVDAGFPGQPNCFRRVLIEIALDAGAAEEPLVFGLDVGKTGHVAFKDSEDRDFDVAFEI